MLTQLTISKVLKFRQHYFRAWASNHYTKPPGSKTSCPLSLYVNRECLPVKDLCIC